MAKSAVATRSVDLEPIDRLEEKVKLLVGMVDRLRGENASGEVLALREERDLIRSRVDEMLQQIEGLNL